jgi:aminopeptidase N
MLNFDAGLMTYSGSVVIQVRVNVPTDTIVLQASKLEIRGVKLEQNKKAIPATYTLPQIPTETKSKPVKKQKKKEEAKEEVIVSHDLTINCSEQLSVGKASLTISFKGSVQKNEPTGIFHCHYSNYDYITTHFESHFARTAFPCFDEFYHRATFTLSLSGFSSTMHCISNTPVSSTKSVKNVTTVTFEKTPSMSPYLLAFTIGHYQHIEDEYVNKNGFTIPIRVFFPPDRSVSIADTVMETIKRAMPLLEDYFEIPNEQKIDFVLVPKLFGGGMENWGCIFLMLTETEKGGKQKKDEGFIELIIHELAHLWVGNRVAMPFHIKEGLAQHCEKNFGDVILGRSSTNTQSSFSMNKQSSTAIIDKNAKSNDFGQVFNGLTYSASLGYVLQVVSRLGEDEFRNRMRKMVEQYAFEYMSEEQFMDICK